MIKCIHCGQEMHCVCNAPNCINYSLRGPKPEQRHAEAREYVKRLRERFEASPKRPMTFPKHMYGH